MSIPKPDTIINHIKSQQETRRPILSYTTIPRPLEVIYKGTQCCLHSMTMPGSTQSVSFRALGSCSLTTFFIVFPKQQRLETGCKLSSLVKQCFIEKTAPSY